MSEAVKRFKLLSEYTFITSPTLTEDDPTDDDTDAGDGGAAGGADDGTDAPANGGQQDGSAPIPQQDAGDASGAGQGGGFPEPSGYQDPQTYPNAGQDAGTGVPQDGSGMPPQDGASTMQDGDEVIDVDDLTDAQEDTEKKVSRLDGKLDGVDDRISTLLKVVDKFQDALDQNSEKIRDLQADLQRRMPTDQERIDLRTHESGPFNVKPGTYWEKVNAENPNYSVTVNGREPGSDDGKEYTLRDSEIKGINDFDVARSFDDPTKRHPLSDYLAL